MRQNVCCIACRDPPSRHTSPRSLPRKIRPIDDEVFTLFVPFVSFTPLNQPSARSFSSGVEGWSLAPRLSRNAPHSANISSFAYRARRGHLHSSVPVLPSFFLLFPAPAPAVAPHGLLPGIRKMPFRHSPSFRYPYSPAASFSSSILYSLFCAPCLSFSFWFPFLFSLFLFFYCDELPMSLGRLGDVFNLRTFLAFLVTFLVDPCLLCVPICRRDLGIAQN